MSDNDQADSTAPCAGNACPPVPPNVTTDPASMTRLLEHFREMLETTLAKALAKIEFSPKTRPASQPVETTVPSRSTGLDIKAADGAKAADLRLALLLGKIPKDAGLLIDARTFAKLLDVSRATLYRLQAEEALPPPVQLGRLTKWRLAEILEWIDAGCPPQKFWDFKRQDSSKRKRY